MKARSAYELEPSDSHLLRSLFSGLRPPQLHLESVLAERSPGKLLVDRPRRPSAAAALAGEGCYIGGDAPSDSFLAAINSLLPRQR